jgi:general secretion pathway protein I
MCPSTSPRSGGFTLLEVMVALVVVAVAFVGLLGVQNRNLKQVGRDQDITRATLLAREIVSQMEVTELFPDTGTSSGQFESAPGFFWEREVTDTDLPTIRQVRLHIIFDQRQPNAYELLYYVRDRTEPDQQQR